jgi:hypothetical protein
MSTTVSGSLRWAVRESLLHYVTVIAGGSYELSDNVTVDDAGVFTFPLRAVVKENADRRVSFAGSIRFTAHHGLLDIRIIDPEVIIGPDAGVIVARTDDSDTVIAIAATEGARATHSSGTLRWRAVPTQLLASGVALFGDVYPAGTTMAPLEMSITLDS